MDSAEVSINTRPAWLMSFAASDTLDHLPRTHRRLMTVTLSIEDALRLINGGFTARVKHMGLDNRWVVPYNPVLLRAFEAHINVELCNSIKSIKYVCKYINKGSDQAAFGLQKDFDKVTRYESGRYISSSEAAWGIFCFPIHDRYPPVMHLSVHLENGQRVYLTPEIFGNRIKNPSNTTLLAFFDLCKVDYFPQILLYSEIPAY